MTLGIAPGKPKIRIDTSVFINLEDQSAAYSNRVSNKAVFIFNRLSTNHPEENRYSASLLQNERKTTTTPALLLLEKYFSYICTPNADSLADLICSMYEDPDFKQFILQNTVQDYDPRTYSDLTLPFKRPDFSCGGYGTLQQSLQLLFQLLDEKKSSRINENLYINMTAASFIDPHFPFDQPFSIENEVITFYVEALVVMKAAICRKMSNNNWDKDKEVEPKELVNAFRSSNDHTLLREKFIASEWEKVRIVWDKVMRFENPEEWTIYVSNHRLKATIADKLPALIGPGGQIVQDNQPIIRVNYCTNPIITEEFEAVARNITGKTLVILMSLTRNLPEKGYHSFRVLHEDRNTSTASAIRLTHAAFHFDANPVSNIRIMLFAIYHDAYFKFLLTYDRYKEYDPREHGYTGTRQKPDFLAHDFVAMIDLLKREFKALDEKMRCMTREKRLETECESVEMIANSLHSIMDQPRVKKGFLFIVEALAVTKAAQCKENLGDEWDESKECGPLDLIRLFRDEKIDSAAIIPLTKKIHNSDLEKIELVREKIMGFENPQEWTLLVHAFPDRRDLYNKKLRELVGPHGTVVHSEESYLAVRCEIKFGIIPLGNALLN